MHNQCKENVNSMQRPKTLCTCTRSLTPQQEQECCITVVRPTDGQMNRSRKGKLAIVAQRHFSTDPIMSYNQCLIPFQGCAWTHSPSAPTIDLYSDIQYRNSELRPNAITLVDISLPKLPQTPLQSLVSLFLLDHHPPHKRPHGFLAHFLPPLRPARQFA
jgi:hypothetical protein